MAFTARNMDKERFEKVLAESIAEIKGDLELLKAYDEKVANGSITDGRKYVEQLMSARRTT